MCECFTGTKNPSSFFSLAFLAGTLHVRESVCLHYIYYDYRYWRYFSARIHITYTYFQHHWGAAMRMLKCMWERERIEPACDKCLVASIVHDIILWLTMNSLNRVISHVIVASSSNWCEWSTTYSHTHTHTHIHPIVPAQSIAFIGITEWHSLHTCQRVFCISFCLIFFRVAFLLASASKKEHHTHYMRPKRIRGIFPCEK